MTTSKLYEIIRETEHGIIYFKGFGLFGIREFTYNKAEAKTYNNADNAIDDCTKINEESSKLLNKACIRRADR